MKNWSDLLRQADPLNDDVGRFENARGQIRRTVVAAASATRPHPGGPVPRRRVIVAAGATLAAALVVVGFFVVPSDRGALQAAVRFEVRLAEAQPVPGLVVARVADSGRTIYLHTELIVTNDDIAQSWVTQDTPDRFGISVQLLDPGAQRMRQATASHIGRPVAILIDGEVVTAPIVRSAIGNSAVISGNYSRLEAERIADGIGVR